MTYDERLAWLRVAHRQLIELPNAPVEGNGVYARYRHPVLTAKHAPL